MPVTDVAKRLRENLQSVNDRIAAAASKAGRTRDDIKLVAVTKYVDAEIVRMLFNEGATDIGESRPQALWDKASHLADLPITWHMIGHLQRNKVRRTLHFSQRIHSVDSLRLLNAIRKSADEAEVSVQVLLEVNVSGEPEKHGFDESTLFSSMSELAKNWANESSVSVHGLMCMAGLNSDDQQRRREFAKLRDMRDRLANQYSNFPFTELSMGMSGDFEMAIEEGATIVRIGSVLFDGII